MIVIWVRNYSVVDWTSDGDDGGSEEAVFFNSASLLLSVLLKICTGKPYTSCLTMSIEWTHQW